MLKAKKSLSCGQMSLLTSCFSVGARPHREGCEMGAAFVILHFADKCSKHLTEMCPRARALFVADTGAIKLNKG